MRRSLGLVVLAVSAVLVVAGCARSRGDASDGDSSGPPISFAGPVQLVAALRFDGGFLPAGLRAIRPPRLAVYSDGRAVASASRTLTLTSPELSDLVRALRRDLAGQPATASPPTGGQAVADAATTVVQVRTADGSLQSVSAYALEILRGYPERLHAARERLDRLTGRVSSQGVPYTAERIRLVAEERTGAQTAGPVQPWPTTVPVPSVVDSQTGLRQADLAGAAAAAATQALPRDQEQVGGWPVRRTGDGLLLAVSWRYLLPDE